MAVGVGRSSRGPEVTESPSETATEIETPRTYSRRLDVLGLLWVLGAALVAILPALLHGRYLGSFDFLTTHGLTARSGVVIHNATTGDIEDEVVPWAQLAWTQVHAGHVPLWVPNSALGMPLAFNFGSAVFSVPALVSYLFPIGAILWVQVLVSFVVGGTGAYFFGRVLGLHPIACALAGTTWVLSGPFFGYLGIPDTSVMSWAGWQFGLVVLIVRGRHRFWSVLLFALTVAASIYAGNPQIEVLILLPLAVFFVVLLLWRHYVAHGEGPVLRPVADLAVATVAGAALSAPLVLPGLQLANASVRNSGSFGSAYPHSQVLGVLFQSFWGQPIAGSFVNGQGFYQEEWVYVGAIALALSVVAAAIRWRRPEVAGLVLAVLVAVAASIFEPADELLNKFPFIGHAWWSRSLIPLAFLLAMLAGVGLDAMIRKSEQRRAARWALGAFAAIAVVLLLVWLLARGNLPAYAARVRAESFTWPVASTVIGGAAFGSLLLVRRSDDAKASSRTFRWLLTGLAVVIVADVALIWLFGRVNLPAYSAHLQVANFIWPAVLTAVFLGLLAVLLVLERRYGSAWRRRGFRGLTFGVVGLVLASQTALLIVDDGPLPSSQSTEYASTPAVAALQRIAGSSVVGLGNAGELTGGIGLGLAPNTNLPYGIHEFAEYDPIAPLSWFDTWKPLNGTASGLPGVYDFDPGILNATVARRYGISYVLEPHGATGPTGGVFVTRLGDEDLYRIPGATAATLVPAEPSGEWPSIDAPGKAVPMERPTPSQVRVVTNASSPQVLRLRLSSFPGWHATIDGRPLSLSPYLTMMLQAHIPAGKHVIELSYWPKRFTEGLVVAALVVVGFVVAGIVIRRRDILERLRRKPSG
jgi:Bacterial membrane protein YfhO